MRRSILCGVVAAVVAFGFALARADERGSEVDLSTFGREPAAPTSV